MSITKRYFELKMQIKAMEKEADALKREILERLGDSPIVALDGCAVFKKVSSGYETINAENLRAMRANATLAVLVQPYITRTADKVALEIKPLPINEER